MSYILDALRKSERERSLGAVPDLETVQQERPIMHASRWPWLVGVLLLFNVAIVIAFFLKEPATVVVAESGETEKTESAVSVVPAGSPEGAMAPAGVPEPARAAGIAANESLLPGNVKEPEPPPTSLAKVETLDIQSPANVSTPMQSLSAMPASDLTEQEPAATDWMDMPPDFRARVSRPDIDVHVYSDEPMRRFVLIDLQKYREGEQIDSGLAIDSITRSGVIFSDQGTRFQVKRP
jgi:general secretion pathway protein B